MTPPDPAIPTTAKEVEATKASDTGTNNPTPPDQQGSALDVLRIKDFRRIFLASVASSTGRWMQNVALGIFAYNLDGSKSFTTLVIGVQLFPLLVLSLPSGSLADTVDRRKLLIYTQAWQAVFGVILAWQVADGEIAEGLLLAIVLAIGIGQALFAPTFTAVIPTLVGKDNLASAIALNSMMINGTRILGPVLGSASLGIIGISGIFLVNSASYLIIIAVLAITPIPPVVRKQALSAKDRLFGGLAVARRSLQVRRSLMVMVTFSLFCLPFIGLMPAIAEERWGIDSEGQLYGLVYATFGLGAFGGVAAVLLVVQRYERGLVIRSTLALFAVALAAMSFVESAALAFPAMFFVGLFYFTMPTVLSTFLQEHLSDEVRGRVMALWIVSFGGIISITNLFSGTIADATSLHDVILAGAVVALGLAIFVRLPPGPVAGEDLLITAPEPRPTATAPRPTTTGSD